VLRYDTVENCARVSFKYDPFGRRIYKSSSSSCTSIYAYDSDRLLEETNGTGAVVARYAQGLKLDEPLAMLRSSTTSFYNADGLATIVNAHLEVTPLRAFRIAPPSKTKTSVRSTPDRR